MNDTTAEKMGLMEQLKKKPSWSLRKERKAQVENLRTLSAESAEYKASMDAIKAIDEILNARTNTRCNIAKVVGGLGVTIAGLVLTYSVGDKGPDMPNKATGRLTDSLLGMFRR